jgi:cytochrome c oxidase subunit 2
MVVLMRHLRASLLLAAAAAAFAVLTGAVPGARGAQQPAQPRQVVEISAERFSFTPSEIKTKVGTTLEIRLRSDDTAHGFHIVGTDVDLELPKRGRGVATVMFTPNKAGRYTFECSQLCGAGHEFMRGVIVASE